MANESRTWFGDVKPGEVVSIDGGRINLRVEKKSGQIARIKLEFAKPTSVERTEPGAALFARRGIE